MTAGEEVLAHWPELVVTARIDTVYCLCGAEFRGQPATATSPTAQWADHVARRLWAVGLLLIVEPTGV